MGKLAHNLAEQHTCRRAEHERNQAQSHDFQRIPVQEGLRAGGSTYRSAQQYDHDIHQGIGSRLCQLAYHAGLSEQVAQHQHAYQRSRGRKDQTYHNRNNDREQYLLQLGNRTKLAHLNLPFFFRGQQLHDRRLDDRHQRHVGICRNCDRPQNRRLPQLAGQEDGCRSVCTADDGDGCRRHIVEAHEDGPEICRENAELRRRAQKEALGVGNQGTEIRHSTHTHENQGRQDGPLVQYIEIIQ